MKDIRASLKELGLALIYLIWRFRVADLGVSAGLGGLGQGKMAGVGMVSCDDAEYGTLGWRLGVALA